MGYPAHSPTGSTYHFHHVKLFQYGCTALTPTSRVHDLHNFYHQTPTSSVQHFYNFHSIVYFHNFLQGTQLLLQRPTYIILNSTSSSFPWGVPSPQSNQQHIAFSQSSLLSPMSQFSSKIPSTFNNRQRKPFSKFSLWVPAPEPILQPAKYSVHPLHLFHTFHQSYQEYKANTSTNRLHHFQYFHDFHDFTYGTQPSFQHVAYIILPFSIFSTISLYSLEYGYQTHQRS